MAQQVKKGDIRMGVKVVNVTDAQVAAQGALIKLGFEPFSDEANSVYAAIENAPSVHEEPSRE